MLVLFSSCWYTNLFSCFICCWYSYVNVFVCFFVCIPSCFVFSPAAGTQNCFYLLPVFLPFCLFTCCWYSQLFFTCCQYSFLFVFLPAAGTHTFSPAASIPFSLLVFLLVLFFRLLLVLVLILRILVLLLLPLPLLLQLLPLQP